MSKCKSLTDKGFPCKRNALPGRRYCFQHETRLFRGATFSGIVVVLLGAVSFFADLSALGIPVPTLAPPPTVTTATEITLTAIPSLPIPSLAPTVPLPTETPWAGPCSIQAFEVQPPSPQPVGTLISIWIKASCIGDVRAIRLMINGEWYSEKGGHIAPPDEFGLNWQTAEYEPGEYQLTAEVATWGDDNWENSASQTIIYMLGNN
jgi:hypothetical protein